MQDFDSNFKEIFSITNLGNFGATSWTIEENKLGIDMSIVTWELFPENFCDHFLPSSDINRG